MSIAPTLRVVPEPGQAQRVVASSVEALADILGMTHAQIAARASIDPTALSKALRGKRKLSVDEMDNLATALNVPRHILYAGGDEIRRLALGAILSSAPDRGPEDDGTPSDLPGQSSPCMTDNVVPLRGVEWGGRHAVAA